MRRPLPAGATGQTMADWDYDGADPGYHDMQARAPAPRRRLVNLIGGVASVALLLGAGWWGYRIAMRDVMGIPVIKAAEGPMRIAPDNPGGEVTEHQGLSVNDVAAVGVATPLPDEIVLAPRPVDLTAEDGPGLAAEPPVMLQAQADEPPQPLLPGAGLDTASPASPDPLSLLSADDRPLDPLTTVGPLDGTPAPEVPADVLALADRLAAGVAPLDAAPEAGAPVAPAPVVPGGIGTSLRPVPRPADKAPVVAAPSIDPAVSAALALAATEIDPSTLTPGTRLVQFGAFESADEARGQWDRLSARFGDLMTGKARVIQSAESGGRTFYRLRAQGFADEDDARRFCAAVTAEGPECIPVVVR